MKIHMERLVLLVLSLLCAGVVTSAERDPLSAFFGGNLVVNGDFEAPDAGRGKIVGWTPAPQGKEAACSIDAAVYLSGKQSLKLSVPSSEASCSVASDLIPVEAGRQYLCSLSFRQDGVSMLKDTAYPYAGVDACPTFSVRSGPV